MNEWFEVNRLQLNVNKTQGIKFPLNQRIIDSNTNFSHKNDLVFSGIVAFFGVVID